MQSLVLSANLMRKEGPDGYSRIIHVIVADQYDE